MVGLLTVIVGEGFTVTEVVTCAVQDPLAPSTETVVDDAGEIVKVLPVILPGFQV